MDKKLPRLKAPWLPPGNDDTEEESRYI